MRQHRFAGTALVLATALALSACGGINSDPPAPTTSAPATSQPPPTSEAPTTTENPTPEEGEVMDGNAGEPSTITVPEWDDQSRSSALETAATILAIYGQNSLTAEQWWANLQPYTSAEAAVWFESIDPRNVPTFTITGEGELVDEGATAWLARVEMPTDLGIFTVLLSRADGAAPWLLESVDLPEDLG